MRGAQISDNLGGGRLVVFRFSELAVRSASEGDPHPPAVGAAPTACGQRWGALGRASAWLGHPAAAGSNHRGELGHSLSSKACFPDSIGLVLISVFLQAPGLVLFSFFGETMVCLFGLCFCLFFKAYEAFRSFCISGFIPQLL